MTAATRIAAGAGALVLIGVAAGITDHSQGAAAALKAAGIAVTQSTIVCPWSGGSETAPTTITVADVGHVLHGPSAAAPSVTVRELARGAAPRRVSPAPSVSIRSTHPAAALAVSASGHGADAIAAEVDQLIPTGRQRSLLSAACIAPATDWWITGADGRIGRTDALMLANPGSTDADVTVTAWSTRGRSTPPRLQSYSMPPGASVHLAVADYVPDAGLVTFHVHANTGRVTAQVIDHQISGLQAAGGDWIGPTQPPSRQLVVPGFPRGDGARWVVITNPGAADATVGLRLITSTSDFVPAGHQQVVVTAGHSTYVDLSEAFGGQRGAVLLSSDAPVTAAGFTKVSAAGGAVPDLQWQPAAPPLRHAAVLAANAPPFGDLVSLFLTAPQGGATVRLSVTSGRSKTVQVPAGRTVSVVPTALFGAAGRGPMVISPVSGGPVYVSRSLFATGAHGPLTTAVQPEPVVPGVVLPPAVMDPAAGVR